ncbi:T9SS type B sorting domain-containing protein [Flavivirga spongiicola]|uniref:T9SS type B sorting domain-containing protein n=1 Tax=Flavivirga spongiicola TaxID=421621 RepID=A0ABU7XPH1_9FLAO|nr:T9SS type B sorting domain-containing protein [Flavivirga sp. MEBiC05379]MDO5977441.1 T9SS type B sorting domain-containing protein [Flavivirga sp. MEBiC05379]
MKLIFSKLILLVIFQSYSQTIDNHFFFLNNSLMESDPVTYAPGSKLLYSVDYNEGANSGYPNASGNYYSSNISMNPFCSSARKTVYNFRQKTGLKYFGSASNFDSYTITIIIKFNNVIPNTYYRVIDFSSGGSDNGIYAYGNNLNFYPTGNVATNVFSGGNFTFLTLTRDATTNVIEVYVNDNLVTSYTDTNNYYTFSNGNVVFARDNIPPSPAPNEDTNGQIAYIHVTNTKSSAAEVKDVYDNICSLIPPNIDAVNDTEPDANWKVGGTVLNIFDNDERENATLNPSDITMSVVSPDPTGNITLNPDGSVDLTPNALTGTYTLSYRICDNAYPSICDTATVTVTLLPIPQIVNTTGTLICDSGTATLNATASAGTINWYSTTTGGFSLGTGTSLTSPLLTNTTTYYVDATDNWRVTETRTPITVTVQKTPLPIAITPQTFCDIDNATISNLTISGTDIQWYAAATGGTPIATTDILATTTYYATQTLNTCESSSRLPVDVIVYESVVLPTIIPDLFECDTNVSGSDTDGLSTFDLTSNETILLNGKTSANFVFSYFEDAAHTISIATPNAFVNNITNGQPIFVRIENITDNSCYTDALFNLIVHPKPIITSIVDLRQCDDDANGFAPFNLTEANVLISTNHLNEVFTYYNTLSEANSGLVANQITNFTAYTNIIPLSDVVYARVETVNDCYRVAQINITVGVSQIPISFTTLQYYECDNKITDNDNTNGIATFDFSDAKSQIEALFPGGVTVTFYNNEADALAELNAIPDLTNHRNEGYPNTQNIYVRVDSDAVNACLGLGHHVTLHVDPLPIKQTITSYILCSDTNEATFDLSIKASEVIGAQIRSILVTYHESEQDAINNISIVNPTSYTSTSKTIYVRAQFDDNANGMLDIRECVNTDMTFELKVNSNPVLVVPDPIRICSEQVSIVYDLTIRANQIINNDSSITLEYFESVADITNNIPIVTPDSYLNTQLDRDIIVVATGTNGCTSRTTLSLKTILYTNLNQNPLPIEECEIDNNGFDNFDTRRREVDILNGLNTADFTFTYYEQEADAIAGNNNAIQSPGNFLNTVINTQTIYARVLPITNECFIVVPIALIVNPVPEIAIEEEYVICLNAASQSIQPELSTFLPNPPIDTLLNITEYSFQWYNGSEAEVTADPSSVIITGAIDAIYTPQVAGDYTVIATNRTTGCTIPASTKVVGSYPPESITVELGSDAFSRNNILDITVVGNGEYEYKLDTTDWQREPRFEMVRGGERIIYVRDIYNCNEIITMQIIIDYPKYFTPNGDGTNDTWNIRGIANQPNAKIYIYDRYGKLLKQLRPTSPGWDGTFNGTLMPTNGYWFTVEYTEPRGNTIKIFKAHFTLKRR